MPFAGRISLLARNERLAAHAGFWWGFAEGLFFFIVPDVYISFAALFSLRTGAVAWAGSIAGSLTALCGIYLLAVVAGFDYLRALPVIPGISGSLVDGVIGQIRADGLPWTPLLVVGGVPLKVYVASAFSVGLSLGSVLLWTIFARLVRIAPTFLVVALIRRLLGRQVDAHVAGWAATLVLFWVAFYAFYFTAMSRT